VLKLNRTLAGGKSGADLDDLYQIWRCIQTSLSLLERMQKIYSGDIGSRHAEHVEASVLAPLRKLCQQTGNFVKLVETTIDMEHAGTPEGL